MSTQPPYTTEPPPETGPSPDERTWAMLCHISGFAGYLGVVPFASVIGPVIVWLLKKDMSPFVDEHGKESITFKSPFQSFMQSRSFCVSF
jgi:uncharacterized Tic20 family protein